MARFKIKKTTFLWGLGITGYYCWFQTFYNAVRFGNMFPYSDFNDMAVGVAKNFCPILILSIINLLIVFRLTSGFAMGRKIAIDILCSLSATLLTGCLYLAVVMALGLTRGYDLRLVDWPGTVLNDIIILMGVELVYYFSMLLKSRNETEAARREALQYQYDALKAQINPHFLFNSLNLLYSLVSIDIEKSKSFISELARMYRYVMAQQNKQLTDVAEELDFLNSYITVLERRYNNKFNVIISGEPSLKASVIPFTMQLLIENVTKHNVISSRCPMTVSVELGDERIVVSNPIRRRNAESVGNIGLLYLSKMYAQHRQRFYVENDGAVFTAYVPLIRI